MNANETTINRLLLQLCKYGKYQVQFNKYESDEYNRIVTKHTLIEGWDTKLIVEYSKRRFVKAMYDLWQSLKETKHS